MHPEQNFNRDGGGGRLPHPWHLGASIYVTSTGDGHGCGTGSSGSNISPECMSWKCLSDQPHARFTARMATSQVDPGPSSTSASSSPAQFWRAHAIRARDEHKHARRERNLLEPGCIESKAHGYH
jgi:hypothetical protein